MEFNLGVGNADLQNGYITLQESLNDYPKLTVLYYSDSDPDITTGSSYTWAGLVFLLESITVDTCLIPGYQKQITLQYVHASKRVMEYPIHTYQFVQAAKGSASKKTSDTIKFSIGTLIGFAQSKVGGNVSAPGFLVELSRNPSPEETVTLKQYIDDQLIVKGLIYKFSEDACYTETLGKGGTVPNTVVSDYTTVKNAVPTYQDTALSWSKKDNYDGAELAKKTYKRLSANEYVIYEGDYKAHLPPGEDGTDSTLPRDLSIMIDNSGVSKSCKVTRYKWGQPEASITATFGYANSALELVADPQKPNASTNAVLSALTGDVINAGNAYQEVLSTIKSGRYGYPDDVSWANAPIWRLTSVKQTDYVYEPLDLRMNPVLQHEDGTFEQVVVPEGAGQFLKSNVEVLVSEKSYGWEIKRFAQEDPGEWTKGSIAAWLSLQTLVSLKDKLQGDAAQSKQLYNWMLYSAKVNLEQYLYRKISLWEQVDYSISPYSKYYKDADSVDWDVQYIPLNVLNGNSPGSDDTPVPVLYPDPNWVPQLMLIASSRYKSSLGLAGNPKYSPFVRNYYGSNPLTLTTGSEEYEYTSYGIYASKNTKPAIGELQTDLGAVDSVLAGIQSSLGDNGTYYKPHSYMNIGDYGIKGVSLGTVNTSAVKGPVASNNQQTDDKYTTTTSIRVAQDQSFKSYVTTQSFTESLGRPPEATTRKPLYEETKDESDSPYKNSATFITSDISNGGIEIVPSISIPAAQNIQEAINGAKFSLTMSILTSGSSASATLVWSSTAKSLINSKINLPNGPWVIKSATQTVQVTQGLPFAQPIEVEAGNLVYSDIGVRTIQIANESNDSDSVKLLLNASMPYRLGSPITQIPADFSRAVL